MTDRLITVSEAVARRKSVRAFLSRKVEKSAVIEILDAARRAPSGGNVQPWKVHVLAGAELRRLVDMLSERMKEGARETPGYEIYPANLWEPYRSYRFKVGEDMYRHAGIAREDKAGRLRQLAANFRFFDAPVGLLFSLDRRMGSPQWADIGMFMQTIMLLAVERGLATCSQECWSLWPDTVGEIIGLGGEDMLFAGMALGYADENAPINQLYSDRADLDSFAVLRGFDE